MGKIENGMDLVFTGPAAAAGNPTTPHHGTIVVLLLPSKAPQSIERFTTLETEPCVKGSLGVRVIRRRDWLSPRRQPADFCCRSLQVQHAPQL